MLFMGLPADRSGAALSAHTAQALATARPEALEGPVSAPIANPGLLLHSMWATLKGFSSFSKILAPDCDMIILYGLSRVP